ncbi:hypothetical protein D5086_004766 [Populus alba]|uniref:Uncharacterized protein n=3 Tax=Populus TaxID=3689 RepID=A0ACC4CRU6_POPAL|nr:hypothetical protein NC653_006487 [Populus alba x Populus x berolinensis]TKS06648.1 uncharacterized protein D5086_0000121010 [Populus alba]
MSVITYPCYFLLSLLCLSLHACTARPLADINNNPEKKFHIIPYQNDQKEISVTTVPTVESSSSKEFGAAKKDSIAKTQLGDNAQKLKDSKAKQKLDSVDEIEKNPGADKKESLVSVSWRVPQKKRGERHPGFNLDYSPPETHPPSHN